MPNLPYASIRTVVHGFLTGGNLWSFGLTASVSGAATETGLQTYADDVADIIATWANTATSGFGALIATGSSIEGVTCYYAPAASDSTLAAAGTWSRLTGSGTAALPTQCAVVVSTHTGALGRRNNGRFYLPLQQATLTAGQLGSSLTAGIALNASIALSAMDLVGAFGEASPLVVGTGARIISSVSVDSVIDTQRRRRNQTVPTTISTEPVTPD